VISPNTAASPLVFHEGLATTAFTVSFCVWIALELLALWRMRQKRWPASSDSEPLALIVFPWLGLWGGSLIAQTLPGLAITQNPFAVGVGLSLVLIGVGLRAWSVRIWQTDRYKPLATRVGPYRFTRHPSYTASLICAVGFGVALANWLSILICVAVPLLFYVPEVRFEETVVKTKLGSNYEPDSSSASRLLPGVW
jgi:protein-S-isoprenylcysteine O-methyltransferase Ste14